LNTSIEGSPAVTPETIPLLTFTGYWIAAAEGSDTKAIATKTLYSRRFIVYNLSISITLVPFVITSRRARRGCRPSFARSDVV
jgi:hypothetical protein